MSSDVDDDQVLPDSLQKLEIVPVYSHSQSACKANNERNQNPFFTELSTSSRIDERVRRNLETSNRKNKIKECHIIETVADFMLFINIFYLLKYLQ